MREILLTHVLVGEVTSNGLGCNSIYNMINNQPTVTECNLRGLSSSLSETEEKEEKAGIDVDYINDSNNNNNNNNKNNNAVSDNDDQQQHRSLQQKKVINQQKKIINEQNKIINNERKNNINNNQRKNN